MLKQETKQITEGDVVAVYGTLRKGCSNYHNLRLRDRADYLGEDYVLGSLYSAPHRGFPFLVEGQEKVKVDLFKVRDSSLGKSLDGLEGFNPDRPQENNNFYIRTAVSTLDGVVASVYHYSGEVQEDFHIPTGDWVSWKSSGKG